MNRKIDRRDIPVDNEILEHIANAPYGGSGAVEYITGRIQSMARELLKYRNNNTIGKVSHCEKSPELPISGDI